MSDALRGRWKRVTQSPCETQYPLTLELREATFLGGKGPGQRFIVWDAGQYEIVDASHIKLQTASDELVVYQFHLSGDTVTFRDPSNCQFQYRRSP